MVFLQFTNVLVQIEIPKLVSHMVQLSYFCNGFDIKITVPLLNLVCLKTLNFLNLSSIISVLNANLNLWPQKVGQYMMIIYSNYFVEVHQVLHCVRSSHRRCSVRKGLFRNSAKLTRKRLCQSLGLATLLKGRLCYRCFPGSFAKFLRTPFLENISGRMLLLRDFNFQTFSIIDFVLPTIKYHNIKCICSECFREGITKFWTYQQFAIRTVVKNLPPGLQ